MARVTITLEARRDLQRIYLYLASQLEERADRITEDIASAAERLADFPESGRLIPESSSLRLREIFVHNYRLVYEFAGDEVLVKGMRHGAQRFNPLDFL